MPKTRLTCGYTALLPNRLRLRFVDGAPEGAGGGTTPLAAPVVQAAAQPVTTQQSEEQQQQPKLGDDP